MQDTKGKQTSILGVFLKQDTKGKQISILRVLTKSRRSSVCVLLQTILFSLHLIVDFLSRMNQNGCFILLDFAQFLPVNALKKLLGASFTSHAIPDRYDLTMIPYTRLVLLLIVHRRNLKVYGLHNHRFLLTKPWYISKAESESNS